MPRYFFHIKGAMDAPDETGTELTDVSEVKVLAIQAAGEALRDLRRDFWDDGFWQMMVADEKGQEILSINISGVLR